MLRCSRKPYCLCAEAANRSAKSLSVMVTACVHATLFGAYYPTSCTGGNVPSPRGGYTTEMLYTAEHVSFFGVPRRARTMDALAGSHTDLSCCESNSHITTLAARPVFPFTPPGRCPSCKELLEPHTSAMLSAPRTTPPKMELRVHHK